MYSISAIRIDCIDFDSRRVDLKRSNITMFMYQKCYRTNLYSIFDLQARPADYATAYLASQEPISFHKFWMIEPEAVYDEWFAEADDTLPKLPTHTEL